MNFDIIELPLTYPQVFFHMEFHDLRSTQYGNRIDIFIANKNYNLFLTFKKYE